MKIARIECPMCGETTFEAWWYSDEPHVRVYSVCEHYIWIDEETCSVVGETQREPQRNTKWWRREAV